MSTPVLVAIILIAVSCAAALTRLRLADRRSVAAHHRALETMARLVAQHPTTEPAASPEQPASQAHVRLVTGTEAPEPPAPPHAPPLRSRPRRRPLLPAEYASWDDVAPAEPAAVADPPPEPPVPVPVAPATSAPVLHFDALAEPPLRSDDSRSAPAPTAPGARRRWHRPRRAWPAGRRRPRRSRSALRRTTVGAVSVLVLAGGAIGALLVSRGPSASVHTPPTVARQATPPTTRAAPKPAPTPAGPVLVGSGAGYSEYRLSGPATIVLSASGRCWVEIRESGPSGAVLFQGVLVAGETQGAPASTWVRLGNPSNVTVRVNGVTISPPSLIAGEPYNLQFD